MDRLGAVDTAWSELARYTASDEVTIHRSICPSQAGSQPSRETSKHLIIKKVYCNTSMGTP